MSPITTRIRKEGKRYYPEYRVSFFSWKSLPIKTFRHSKPQEFTYFFSEAITVIRNYLDSKYGEF